MAEMTKKALSRELKKVETTLIGDCLSEPINEERSDKNKSSQVWMQNMPRENGIKLEIGAVVRPEPYEMRPVKSYIGKLQVQIEHRYNQETLSIA